MSNLPSPLPPTLDIQMLATLLKCSKRTIQRLLKDTPSELPPGRRCGNKWIFRTDETMNWISPTSLRPPKSANSLAEQLLAAGKKD